ncbi:MAG: hypothetical protein KAI50_15275 [Desulfobacterales bacterium]|nr:hypothetical protein [Desulfobacterales bacterium]
MTAGCEMLENKRLDEIQILLDEINARRNELNLREQFILKIMSSFLAVLFIIFGYAFKEGVYIVFLLIPAFLASGLSLILHQERIIYSLGAYIFRIENEVNSYLSKKCLNWEKVIHEINSTKKIQFMDGSLHFIIMFPMLVIYIYSLYYIKLIYSNEWFFPYVFSLYIVYVLIISVSYWCLGTRRVYEWARQIVDKYYDEPVKEGQQVD